MKNYGILISFPEDKFMQIFYEVHDAIQMVAGEMGDDKIIVAVPRYFIDVLRNKRFFDYGNTPLFLDDEKATWNGRKVQWNYENFIVVFHEDNPLYGNTNYKVIDLK